jgi:hypothetical protein
VLHLAAGNCQRFTQQRIGLAGHARQVQGVLNRRQAIAQIVR